jgi:magnesium-transporting ATPase (P-type)
MTLEEREETMIKIKDSGGIEHTYDILQHFPFSSETKRMGIILKE